MKITYESEDALKNALLAKESWKSYISGVYDAGGKIYVNDPRYGLLDYDIDEVKAVMGVHRCDFCGEEGDTVVSTKYGTSNYNRLICKKCIDRINDYHKCMDGWEKTLNDDGSYAN